MRFRTNMKRLGAILAYEFSKSLKYKEKEIQTPLAKATVKVMGEQPVLVPIMRAALPFFDGIQQYFDRADAGFVGAFRASDFNETGGIELGYAAVPDLTGRAIALIDPMLATGKSLLGTLQQLVKHGVPRQVHILCLLASPAGIRNLKEQIDLPFDVWCIAVDKELNDKAYIVPGLGDAGDLAFGPKK